MVYDATADCPGCGTRLNVTATSSDDSRMSLLSVACPSCDGRVQLADPCPCATPEIKVIKKEG